MNARLFSHSSRLLVGTLLGALALGSTAHPAAAVTPLDLLGPLGSVLSPRPAQPQPPSDLDFLTDNVRNNNLNLCVLTCSLPGIPGLPSGPAPTGAIPPGAIPPGAIPQRIPTGAIPPGAIPPGAIPPGAIPPGAIPPGAIPSAGRTAPPPSGPATRTAQSPAGPTLILPPIQF